MYFLKNPPALTWVSIQKDSSLTSYMTKTTKPGMLSSMVQGHHLGFITHQPEHCELTPKGPPEHINSYKTLASQLGLPVL